MTPSPRSFPHLPSQADLFYLCTTLSTSDTDLNTQLGPPSAPRLKVGVLLLDHNDTQLLDLAPIDMLDMLDEERAERLHAPVAALGQTISLEVHFVSENGEGTVPVTSGATISVTSSFHGSPQFNLIIIPGASPAQKLSDSASAFLTLQSVSPNLVSIMTISSGIIALAQTEFLKEKRATAPAYLLRSLREQCPETEWQATKWTRQENIWSSSSSIGGIEMMAAWMRQYFWDRFDLVEWALSAAGLPPRNYGNS